MERIPCQFPARIVKNKLHRAITADPLGNPAFFPEFYGDKKRSMQTNRIRLSLILTALSFSGLFLFSCSKSGGLGIQPPPQAVDSFFSWQVMTNVGSPGAEDIWFVSPSKGFYGGSDKNIHLSLDSGKTWSTIANTTAPEFLNELFFVDVQYGFAQTPSHLELTRDGGNTWTLKTLPTTTGLNIFFTTPAIGFCGDQNSGLYRTTDTGNTWNKVYALAGTPDGYYPFFLNPGIGFFFTGNGIFDRSVDSGASWISTGLINFTNPGISFSTLQFVDAQNGFFAGLYGLLKTTDGGQNWNTIYNNISRVNIVKFFDVNTGYYMADSAIYKTIDGGQNWSTSAKLTKDEFTGMHFINPTTGWACSTTGIILRINQ
jgi:photosystem II stability/assembly factor-like uncharacterized protein